jgi:hypothetical protein
MRQNLLAFFKDSCPLSTSSIVTSNASNVHIPHCFKLGTLFILASFFFNVLKLLWNVLFIGGLLVLEVISSLARYNGHHDANPLPFGPNF